MQNAEVKFEQYRKHLRLEAMRLVSFVNLYRHINERKTDRLSELNIAPSFFQTILDALFSGIILWVDKLLGAQSERGFYNFLTFVENNRKIFEIYELQRRRGFPDGHWMLDRKPIEYNDIKIHRELISQLTGLPHVKLRRDKFHAHFDKKYFFERKKIKDDAPLKWSDLEEIVQIMGEIINYYSAAYDGTTYHLEPFNIHDIDNILDLLYSHNQKRQS